MVYQNKKFRKNNPNQSKLNSLSNGICERGEISLSLFKKRFYLFIHERPIERERVWQRHRQREKQAPFREPDVGLDPGTPGPRPGPKAGKALNC